MQYLKSSSKEEILQLQNNWQSYFTIFWEKSHPSRIKGCNNYPPIQTERESSNLCIISRWEDLCKGPIERLNEHLEQSELLPGSHCVFRKDRGTTNIIFKQDSFKMSGTEFGLLHDFCRTYQSICHSQSGGNLDTYSKVSRSCQIHSNGAAVPRWYACKGQNDGEFSDPFRVTNGFRQDCVLAVHCSAWCFRPCSQMLSRMVIFIYLLKSLYYSKIDTFFYPRKVK